MQTELPAKNISEWVMPLDQYIPQSTHISDYAENLLVEPCMSAKGYTWDVPWQDVQEANIPTLNAVERKLFNVQIAQKWGYHPAYSTAASDLAWANFGKATSNIPDAEESALDTCINDARKTLPRLPLSAQTASSLGQGAYDAAQKSAEVTAAAKKWGACMAPEGISDLPQSPNDMPTDSLEQEFDINQSATPSAQEIAVAVKDAKCRDSSGWTTAAYNAEWNRQVKLLEQNADMLKGIAAEVAKNKAETLQVIASNAPQAPSNGQ